MMKKEPSLTRQSTPNPSLPDDLLLSCFARVSRLYYPTLSLVSKRFQSLLASPELYKAMSLLGHTESCLYVCVGSDNPRSRWYTLCRKPDQTLINDTSEKKKPSKYVLATVPVRYFPRARCSGLVAVGSDIYNIERECSGLSILDCTSHTWRYGPSLRVKLLSLSASVVDQKIYVVGRSSYKDGDSNSLTLEVFDTKSQTWDPEPIPFSVTKFRISDYKSASIDGKFHAVNRTEVVTYSPKEGRWDLVGPKMTMMGDCMHSDSYCEIENVLYSGSYRELQWYDAKVNTRVEILEGFDDGGFLGRTSFYALWLM